MKLLFDQNLSPRLARLLQDLYPGSCHVQDLYLDRAPDEILWGTAQREGFIIVTRDSDFADRPMLALPSPKIVWIRVGNCTTREIEALLRDHLDDAQDLNRDLEASVLIIR